MIHTIVVTGASGFLGQTILDTASRNTPDVEVVPVHSPQSGGIDLSLPDAPSALSDSLHIEEPENALLIHAAARVSWDSPDALLTNAAMALNVATWARTAGIGFCVLVSSVNVLPGVSKADVTTTPDPQTLYGVGKLTAEYTWRQILPDDRRSIVRLAGIWGWQRRSTLFWNSLLLATARGSAPEKTLVVRRGRSRRNYISANEASKCLLQVGMDRITGLFLAAGREVVDTKTYVDALQGLQGSRLSVDWQDDGGEDEQVYTVSRELLPCLESFSTALTDIWTIKPAWVLEGT